MKHRTNQARADRKARKLTELITKRHNDQKKQIHTNFSEKSGYAAIMASIRLKTSVQTIRQAHPGRDIARIQLMPKILWYTGTYIRAEHGDFASA